MRVLSDWISRDGGFVILTERTVTTNSPGETRALAERLVSVLPAKTTIALRGELGAGKTCFVKGLASGLQIKQPVTSPTYTIVNEYAGASRLYHIDFYRIGSPDEALALGLDDYLEAEAVCAIEWPERITDLLPADAVRVQLEPGIDPEQRKITVTVPESLGAVLEAL
jgi:tRNA threonylcarbamoyladenosine biosynthesis protein TsaE